jgi:UDP-glucose 4-epimerase
MPGQRILVTGGNGYVGREVTSLLRESNTVCVVDLLRHGDWRVGGHGVERVVLDIRDGDMVDKVMTDFRPEVIVHLAAIHYIPECEAQPALTLSTNVMGTLNLLSSAPEGCRFVFASSGAVYAPSEKPQCEVSSEIGPSDIYGLSKLHGEHYVSYFARQRGLQAIILRLFNVIGPGETSPHLLPELVAQLKAGRSIIELGNLSPRRDYISVRDAAHGFTAAATQAVGRAGETCTVNLGTAQAYSVLEVVEKLRRISGVDFAIRQMHDRVRPVDRPILTADLRRLSELFAWRPRDTIDDTLAALWERPDLSEELVARYR